MVQCVLHNLLIWLYICVLLALTHACVLSMHVSPMYKVVWGEGNAEVAAADSSAWNCCGLHGGVSCLERLKHWVEFKQADAHNIGLICRQEDGFRTPCSCLVSYLCTLESLLSIVLKSCIGASWLL